MDEKIKLSVLEDIRKNIKLNLPRILIGENIGRSENVRLNMQLEGKYCFYNYDYYKNKIMSLYYLENAYWSLSQISQYLRIF